ncbi:MAG: hypothetical protein J3K34DRAFT_521841 [Monoraphidium minutum]|nr:MAG: hypothetical protein J3K34DRAFT_521841 [Monoraphidium minutum]
MPTETAAMGTAAAAEWAPELKRAWSAACGGGAVRAILLSPRGKVAATTASSVFLFDGPPAFGLRRELRGQPAGLTAAAFSCKGTDIVSGGADGFLKWWQVDSGDELCSTQFPQGDGQPAAPELAIPEVACSRGGFVAAVSGRLLCIFGPGGEHLHTLDVNDAAAGALQHVTWLDEHTVLGCCGSEATIWRVDQDQYEEVGTFATLAQAHITQLAMSPNGRYLAAACGNNTVQVWDVQQEGSMDPLLVISEGLGDGAVARLSWDEGSRLLAAAAGGEVLVWDVAGAKEGRVESSFVCAGFEGGARVTCLAFQPNGKLLAAASDGGLCLVFDSAAFCAGAAAAAVSPIASGRLGDGSCGSSGGGAAEPAATPAAVAAAEPAADAAEPKPAEGEEAAAEEAQEGKEGGEAADKEAGEAEGGEQQQQEAAAPAPAPGASAAGSDAAADGSARADTGAVEALAWHSSGALVLGTSTGVVGALQPQRPPRDDAPPDTQAAKRRSSGTQAQPSGAANGAAAAPKAGAASRGAPAGWGGEPLVTNGVGPAGGQDAAEAPPMGGMAMRGGRAGGRGMRGGAAAGGRYGPPMQPYFKSARDGMPPGGPPKPGGMQQQPGGGMSPEQHMQMQAAAAAQWGMPAAMAPQMWRHMQMGYAVSPYGQMMAVPQMPGMAPAMAGYPGMAMPQMAPPHAGGRGGYAPVPRGAIGGPMGGRGGGGRGGAAMGFGGYQGAGGAPAEGGRGGGGGGPAAGGAAAAPYARRPSPGGGEGRPERGARRDGGSPPHDRAGSDAEPASGGSSQEQQHSSHSQEHPQQQHPQQPQQQQPMARAPSASSHRSGERAGGRGGGGEQWHGDGGERAPAPPAYAGAGAPAAAHAAMGGAPAAMMARPPYGMSAPVYMFPQAGMAGMGGMMPWGMYPGQMAAFPTPGGYMVYPTAAAAYGGAAAPGAMVAGAPGGGMGRADGGEPRKGGGGGGGGGGDGGARGGGGGPRAPYGGSYAASEESGASSGYRGGGGGYASSSGYSGSHGAGPLTTLYIGNLAPGVDEDSLSAQFVQFGPVERAQVIRDRETGDPKGYGFVTFSPSAPAAAPAAMARLNGAVLDGVFQGRTVRVSPSNKWRNSDAGGGGSSHMAAAAALGAR